MSKVLPLLRSENFHRIMPSPSFVAFSGWRRQSRNSHKNNLFVGGSQNKLASVGGNLCDIHSHGCKQLSLLDLRQLLPVPLTHCNTICDKILPQEAIQFMECSANCVCLFNHLIWDRKVKLGKPKKSKTIASVITSVSYYKQITYFICCTVFVMKQR